MDGARNTFAIGGKNKDYPFLMFAFDKFLLFLFRHVISCTNPSPLQPCLSSFVSPPLSGFRGLQGRLEQSIGARGFENAGWMYPPLSPSANRRPLPGGLLLLAGAAGVPAGAFQPIGKPRHEHSGLSSVRGRSTSGICCSQSCTW